MAKTVVIGILSGAGFLALVGAILFGCAGRWDLPMFWAYLGVWAAALTAHVNKMTRLKRIFFIDPLTNF